MSYRQLSYNLYPINMMDVLPFDRIEIVTIVIVKTKCSQSVGLLGVAAVLRSSMPERKESLVAMESVQTGA